VRCPMQVGEFAKYRVTGTVGKVLEVRERDGAGFRRGLQNPRRMPRMQLASLIML